MRTVPLTPEIRSQKREEIKIATAKFNDLKSNSVKFDHERNELLKEFNSSALPVWGGLIFNGMEI